MLLRNIDTGTGIRVHGLYINAIHNLNIDRFLPITSRCYSTTRYHPCRDNPLLPSERKSIEPLAYEHPG
jgi:hypothetical protein